MQREKPVKKHGSAKGVILYLMVGYPGSGKTTTSQIIHDLTGATHIWADYERRAMFGEPTHSKSESHILYDHLNKSTELLLSDGISVIFDTNFNFRKDRDMLRNIAQKYNAVTRLLWIKTDKVTARKRAVSKNHANDNNYADTMTLKDFDRMTGHLEPPVADEEPLILDGESISPEYVASKLKVSTKHPAKHSTPAVKGQHTA